jgi:hypothetical protein
VTLIELQRRMAADLMRPLTGNDNLSRTAKAADYVAPNGRLTSHQRLQIYSRSYWYRILDSLHDDFPGLRSIIGDDAFHKLSRAYLAAHPSRSFTMRNLGSALEPWLRRRPHYTGGKQGLALDMVRLEWAHIEAFDGPSTKPLGPEDLLEPGPELRVALQPYMSLLEVHYPVDDLRVSLNCGAVNRPTEKVDLANPESCIWPPAVQVLPSGPTNWKKAKDYFFPVDFSERCARLNSALAATSP